MNGFRHSKEDVNMDYAQQQQNYASQAGQLKDRPASRIENDVQSIKTMTNHVENITDRIIRHARSLGYYEPTPQPATAAPTPVVSTLSDALQALARAVDHCSDSLNVFE